MDITKERIMKLVSNAHDMAGLDDITKAGIDSDGNEDDDEISVDFDEGVVSDLDVDEALPMIEDDALFDLIAKSIDADASGDGEYSIKHEEISFFFQLIETTKDDSYRIIPVSKTCKARWDSFMEMLNLIVKEIKVMQTNKGGASTHFELSYKRKENDDGR